jgi:hypothetical protein
MPAKPKPNTEDNNPYLGSAFLKNSKREEISSDFLSSVSDAPDFHDPFSELNLFLCQEIKE